MSEFGYTVDTSGLDKHIQEFDRQLVGVLDRTARSSLNRLAEHMASHIDAGGPAPGEFSGSSRVGNRSGRLHDALFFGNEANSSKIIFTTNGVEAIWIPNTTKVPYLRIQNDGGFVRHKGKMPFKLFRLAQETGIDNYRIMGAAALRDGGITITAHPFIEPGTKEFESQSLPRLKQELDVDIVRTWNALQ